jgi:FxsC-like protein
VSHIQTRLNGPGRRASYFFLSYAQSPPLAGTAQADPDQSVRKFNRDLTAAVRSQASPQSGLEPGSSNYEIPLGSDWKASLTEALSLAEVFVPLYSPGYFARSRPGREWTCFQQRLLNAGISEPLQRFAAVLWTPLPRDLDSPDLRAAMADADSEYAENGLRTLLRLRPYRLAYARVVRRLAAHIVDLAENSPVGPSEVPDIDEVQSEFKAEAYGAVFAVTVAAPVLSGLPLDRDPAGYGSSGVEWRPYPRDQELPLAEYAARIAEQMDFAVLMTSMEKRGDQLTSRPGVVLIDPWFIAQESGRAALRSFLDELPAWVLPLLVLGASTDSRSAELADQVRSVLSRTFRTRGDAVQRGIRGVKTLQEFVALVPILAAEAERQYLRHGPVPRSTAKVGRPRLADGLAVEPPRAPTAPPDHQGETPNV